MNNQKGLTLVELISTLAIISTLTVISAETFGALKPRLELNATVMNIVTTFNHARMATIRFNELVVIDYTDKRIRSFVDDGSGTAKRGDWEFQTGETILHEINLDDNVDIDTAASNFSAQRTAFYRGLARKAGTLVLKTRNGMRTKVVLSTLGRVRVEKL